MTGRRTALAAAAALSVAAAAPAAADAVTYDISFSATGFAADGLVSTPVDPVTGEFAITFDPAKFYLNETAGVVLHSLAIALGSTPAFTYDPAQNEFLLGGLIPGGGLIDSSKPNDDFSLDIHEFTTGAPVIESFLYMQKSRGTAEFEASSSSVQVAIVVGPVGAPVPEPSTWVMLMAGFAGIGALGRWRMTRTPAPAA